MQVDADRLIAWQLNWHGENFWSSGRTFSLITEAGRVTGLRSVLPTERARATLEVIDTSCNKFTLVRFVL